MVDVGPTHTLRVEQAQVLTLAGDLDTLAWRLGRHAVRLGEVAASIGPTLALSPVTGAAAEAGVGAGLGMLGVQAVGLLETAGGARTALAGLVVADETLRFAGPAVEVGAGMAGRALLHVTPQGLGALGLGEALAATEGPAAVRSVPTPASLPTSRSLSDLLRALDATNGLDDGVIQVQTLTDPAGRRRHVVLLPGTDSFMPWDRGARNTAGNLAIRMDEPTTYEDGIARAMRASGIRPDEPVLLVGHSQGGMAAVDLARQRDRGFLITNVVTAGSPVGDRDLPAQTRLLALENRGDLVPTLDGARRPDGPGRLTIGFSDGLSDPLAAHHLPHYVHGAQAAEESDDPRVTTALADLAPFLTGTPQTQTWQISRAGG